MYFGKIRAAGGNIRGFKGVAGGVIRWMKLVNDTAVAVDQLGMRQGAVAVYLDVWHKDLPEFLQLRTNNGDDRMKAHDIFPAVCYPDLFWRMAKQDLNQQWYLFCPNEIMTGKGYCLEDYYGTSAIPTSKPLSGMAFINMFMEHPEGIAGVTPTILSFVWASSNRVFPKTS